MSHRNSRPIVNDVLEAGHELNPLSTLQKIARFLGFSGAIIGAAGVYLFFSEQRSDHVFLAGTLTIVLKELLHACERRNPRRVTR